MFEFKVKLFKHNYGRQTMDNFEVYGQEHNGLEAAKAGHETLQFS